MLSVAAVPPASVECLRKVGHLAPILIVLASRELASVEVTANAENLVQALATASLEESVLARVLVNVESSKF